MNLCYNKLNAIALLSKQKHIRERAAAIYHNKIRKGAININILKKIICCALTAVICSNLCACRGDPEADKIFKFDVLTNPGTLDPQQADDSVSNMIIENVYAGLLSVDQDGSVSKVVAEDYTVSDDGLVYNFKLREDIFWTSVGKFDAQCTAKDFVYGFTRLFLPQTNAPRASEYYCIKNSEAVQNGENVPLGVRAVSDFELEIMLEYPNPRFAALLAEPPAMPCSEEFFIETQGKYGLSAKCTPSNGAFYVRGWNYDPYTSANINNLILSRNAKNAEVLDVKPSGLNFFITKESNFYPDFVNGDTHCLVVSNDGKQPPRDDFNCDEFSNITCGLIFNNEFSLFQSVEFRQALSILTNRDTISSALPGVDMARGIVSEHVSAAEAFYRETVGDCEFPEYNPERAQQLYQSARPSLDTSLFSGSRVIVCSDAAKTAVSYILQEWQREFGFYCVVETLDENAFRKRLQSGDYEIAAVELSGKYNSPAAFLEQFGKTSSENFGHFSDSTFDGLLADANVSASDDVELFYKAEQRLIDEAAFVPLFYKKEYFFTPKGSTGVIYNPFSETINFMKAMM